MLARGRRESEIGRQSYLAPLLTLSRVQSQDMYSMLTGTDVV